MGLCMADAAEKFLTPAEKKAVEVAVAAAERQTSGEIVVMVVSSSHHYQEVAYLYGFAVSLGVAFALSLLLGDETLWHFAGVLGLTFVLVHQLLLRVPVLMRPLVSAAQRRGEVERSAFAAFHRSGVANTVGRTGILLYISLFEHTVRVVADRGIDEKLGHGFWQEIVDGVVAGIRERRQGAAVVAAVERCGEKLAVHFPVAADDRNELDDAVIIGSSGW